MTLGITFNASNMVKDGRTLSDVLGVAMEELGELSTEIAIKNGHKIRAPGKDGIIGECVDVITAIEDILYLINPTLTQNDINDIKREKCKKWVDSKL